MLQYIKNHLLLGVLFCTLPSLSSAQSVEQFTIKSPSDNKGLSRNSHILSIEETAQGFYVLTKKNGCYLVNQRGRFPTKPILAPDNRRDYFLDLIPNQKAVSLWANGNELISLNHNTDDRQSYSSSLFSKTVQTNSIAIDKKGTIYVGTEKDGIFVFTQDEWGNYTELARRISAFGQELPSNNIQCIYKDNDGVIWIGTDAGLASITDGEVKNLSFAEKLPKGKWARFLGLPPEAPAFAEPIDAIVTWGNSILMANDKGLYKASIIQDSVKHISHYNLEERLSSPLSDIGEMIVDIDGNLWIAANHLIHYNITADKLTEMSNIHYFKGQGFLSLGEDTRNDKILVGTIKGGLYQLNYQNIDIGMNW